MEGTMRFTYHIMPEFAKLSWCAKVNRGAEVTDVYAGAAVECQDTWFVSGVWDGDFRKADFDTAEFFCGTGAKIQGGEVVFYSYSHERQRLCCLEQAECFFVSNSIPMLLAVSGNAFDVNCDQYEKILCAILDGLKDYDRNIPLAGGVVMQQIFCADIHVNRELKITVVPKPRHRDFTDYQDYHDSLVTVCKKIKANGEDPARTVHYRLATTASSGYDSGACAAIAREAGCDTMMTFCGGSYDEDSGVTIGKQLGYTNIIERSYDAFKTKKDSIDAQFVICGDIGIYLQFSAFEDDFAGHVVFSGTSGSYTYDKDSKVNEESKRSGYDFYTANLSFSENALIKGYIFLPMPLYASNAVESIQRITNSPEMEPWTLHTDYDRPICRRMLETMGVDGACFGHVKHGAGFCLSRNFTLGQMKPKMSAEGFESFSRWIKIPGNNRWDFARVCRVVQYHASLIPVYFAFVLNKLGIENKIGQGNTDYPNPGLPAKLILWGMETVTAKYADALKKAVIK